MASDPRGTRIQRGYTAQHDRLRAHLVATATPHTLCARCHLPLGDPKLAHLGHNDTRTGWHGLEHPTCNTTAANRARAQRAKAARARDTHPGWG